MTSVSSVAAKESPAQESWITFGRSTHSSSLLKPAIFFFSCGVQMQFHALLGCLLEMNKLLLTCSFWRSHDESARYVVIHHFLCAERIQLPALDIRWAIRGEDSWFIRKDVFFRSWTQRGPSGAWLASPAGWVEFICGGQAGVEWKKTVLILPQI